MDTFHLYQDIQARTKGEIYIGVVGPVRTGKSTFVRRFMEQLVLPHMKKENSQVSKDELPVSGGGKTITTVEPKFVPAKAAEVELDEGITAKIRLIDCVGFVIDGAFGLDENNQVRMVKTPWLKEAIPFPQAAEIGTGKVIRDHSTVGILVTTDGTIGDFPREAYKSAEEKTVLELKKTGKPFVIVLNSQKPYSQETKALAEELSKTYETAVIPVNCEQMKEEDIRRILTELLYAFPLTRIEFFVPRWPAICGTISNTSAALLCSNVTASKMSLTGLVVIHTYCLLCLQFGMICLIIRAKSALSFARSIPANLRFNAVIAVIPWHCSNTISSSVSSLPLVRKLTLAPLRK